MTERNFVLEPFLSEWFMTELGKKVKLKGASVKELVRVVEVELNSFNREIIRSSLYKNEKNTYALDSGRVELKIKGNIGKLTFCSVFEEDIINEDVQFELKMAKREMTLLNPHIFTEAKVKLNRLAKMQAPLETAS